MEETKEKIARNLEAQFAAMGFAKTGVDTLQAGAEVSLRTLYKYYPSREAMVIGALSHRDQVYLAWIAGGPAEGNEHVLHVFERLGAWLEEVANTGCLFMNALSAYPDDAQVRQIVKKHKLNIRQAFVERVSRVAPHSNIEMLADALFTIHEGQTDTARILSPTVATQSALRLARTLMQQNGVGAEQQLS